MPSEVHQPRPARLGLHVFNGGQLFAGVVDQAKRDALTERPKNVGRCFLKIK
jgi:hypothetical protein